MKGCVLKTVLMNDFWFGELLTMKDEKETWRGGFMYAELNKMIK